MSLVSFNFLVFIFFVFITFYYSPDDYKKYIILFANIIFYSYAGVEAFLGLIILSLIVYYSAKIIGKKYDAFDKNKSNYDIKEQRSQIAIIKNENKPILILSLILILGYLIFIKVATGIFNLKSIIYPLGVSYYCFSCSAYIIDVYWRKAKYETSYISLLTIITFFPVIVQGPIGRYQRLIPQINALSKPNKDRIIESSWLILIGFLKKLVVADRLAILETEVVKNLNIYSGLIILVAIIFDVFKLYADFSACMDIAAGISAFFGIKLDSNFKQPFCSKSASEFWRRWHITLGTWFKDFVYMPIATNASFLKLISKIKNRWGSNAAKNLSSIIPLMIVWMLTGLWHGTGVDYICWGLYWGGIISLSSVYSSIFKNNTKCNTDIGNSWLRMLRTFILFAIGRTITMCGDLNGMFGLYREMLTHFFDGEYCVKGFSSIDYIISIVSILLIVTIDYCRENDYNILSVRKKNIIVQGSVYLAMVYFIILFGIYGIGYNASDFIYGVY